VIEARRAEAEEAIALAAPVAVDSTPEKLFDELVASASESNEE
jgi:DNA-directed RNA polymerase subunit beta'